MTAASIKMDELLVNWLGSDAVYSDILQWVENYSTTDGKNKTPLDNEPNNETGGLVSQVQALKINNSEQQQQQDKAATTTTTTTTTIKHVPPFYPVRNKLQRLPKKISKTKTHTMTPTAAITTIPSILTWSEAQPLAEQLFREAGNNHSDEAALAGSSDSNNSNPDFLSLIPDAFVRVTKEICRFPSYFNAALYQRILDFTARAAQQQETTTTTTTTNIVTLKMFQAYWMAEMEPFDETDRFFRLMKQPDADAICRDDFLPFLKALLSDHPGLEFLSSHDEFQEKYAVSIITRIFYHVNTSHSGSITARQLRRSDLLEAFQVVDEEEDINKIPRYFSYEHFYVLYCRFWELDDDRDYRITRDNLLKYGEHSLSHMIVDRIFEAAPRPFGGGGSGSEPQQQQQQQQQQRDYLTFEDFIYFMLAEEDKANEVSIRYWFDCLDVDADGKLNNLEMRSFYAVQLHRMQNMSESVPFEDMLCQMIDMIKPANPDYLVVSDFLQKESSSVAGALFDALFNLNKYLMFEQRDPFMERQKREDEFQTEWDRFANADYNRLAMEEEAREEEAMEIDWVTVDEEEEAAAAATAAERRSLKHTPAIEAPF